MCSSSGLGEEEVLVVRPSAVLDRKVTNRILRGLSVLLVTVRETQGRTAKAAGCRRRIGETHRHG